MKLCEYGCGRIAKYHPRKGMKKWCCEETYRKCPEVKRSYSNPGEQNPMYGKKRSSETKNKISKANKGKLKGIPKSKKWKKFMSERMKGKGNPQFGKENTEIQKEKKRNTMKKKFKNDKEYVNNWISGMNAKPNKCEIKVMNILDEVCPNKFKYVGDFKKWIGRRNPDFIDEIDKKIIEHFGWVHTEENRGIPEDVHEKERISYFNQYGYNTLIIWESELEDDNKIKERIRKFIK